MSEKRFWIVVDGTGTEQQLTFKELAQWVADGRLNEDDRVRQPDQKDSQHLEAVIGLAHAVKNLRQSIYDDAATCRAQAVEFAAMSDAVSVRQFQKHRRHASLAVGAIFVVAASGVWCCGIVWYQFYRWQQFPPRAGVPWTARRFWWPGLNELGVLGFVALILDTLILTMLVARWLQNRETTQFALRPE